MPPRYSKTQAEEAVAASLSYAETLRRLGKCSTGGSAPVLKKYLGIWGISTAHFDPRGAQKRGLNRGLNRCLSEVLVDHSSYSRKDVKRRLFTEGVKERVCELCGQDEEWRGRRMGLVLDHINGVRDDHRLENLRIVCPNCNATLEAMRRFWALMELAAEDADHPRQTLLMIELYEGVGWTEDVIGYLGPRALEVMHAARIELADGNGQIGRWASPPR